MRLMLQLPVCLLGLPLLVGLIVTSARLAAERAVKPPEIVAPEVTKADAIPDAAGMERLASTDPVAFLEHCIRRYEREVKGYTLTMQKQELIGGKLQPVELLDVQFREKPFSVTMRWLQGARMAAQVLYVEGENNGKMLVRPNLAFLRNLVVEREVNGEDARQSGRYTLDKYGMKNGTLRTLATWKAAKEEGTLRCEYLGQQSIKDAGERTCYVLRRHNARPEYDGVLEVTIFMDKENWLQVGSIVRGEGGKLIGEYYFRDIRLNPEFKSDAFQRSVLKP